MKYCFSCGAPLAGSAASFCSECGKAMPKRKERRPEPKQNPQTTGKRPPPPGKPKGQGKPPPGYKPPPPSDTRSFKGPPPAGVARNGSPPIPQTQTRIMPQREEAKGTAGTQPLDELVEATVPDEFAAEESLSGDESEFASESGEQPEQPDEFYEEPQDEAEDGTQNDAVSNPHDESYDGYYNDILPEDDGYISERLEPELIKRIALVIGGVLVIVLLSVLVMKLL